jgi:tRNA threonylcarbamoyl adenosine modification protein YeaZ
VGIATAQVLASIRRVPLRGVCTLDVLAAQHAGEHHGAGGEPSGFLVATDARRKEVYWARYDRAGIRLEGPKVGPPEDLPALPTVGPAADLYPDRLEAVLGPRQLDPGVLAAVGWNLPDAGTAPLYLRRPDATEPSARKPVLLAGRQPSLQRRVRPAAPSRNQL